jgi:group I intron endonuclease
MNSIGIYKITNPKGRIYVGQSIDIEKRFRGYKKLSNCKKQTKLYNSFIKYGTINHTFEIIELCSLDMLNEKERYWQEFYNCLNGLNCNYVSTLNKKQLPSNEVLIKMSIAKSGKKQSENHIVNRVKSKQGYKHSNETKNKISIKRNKLLIDLQTGIFYDNAREASIALNIKKTTLEAMIGPRKYKNKTSITYA